MSHSRTKAVPSLLGFQLTLFPKQIWTGNPKKQVPSCQLSAGPTQNSCACSTSPEAGPPAGATRPAPQLQPTPLFSPPLSLLSQGSVYPPMLQAPHMKPGPQTLLLRRPWPWPWPGLPCQALRRPLALACTSSWTARQPLPPLPPRPEQGLPRQGPTSCIPSLRRPSARRGMHVCKVFAE